MNYLRIKKNKDFQKLLRKGKKCYASSLVLLYAPAKSVRMGICVGKKHGKAHTRNRIKRLLREVFRKQVPYLKGGYSFILLPKVRDSYSYKEFEACLCGLLRKEKLI